MATHRDIDCVAPLDGGRGREDDHTTTSSKCGRGSGGGSQQTSVAWSAMGEEVRPSCLSTLPEEVFSSLSLPLPMDR